MGILMDTVKILFIDDDIKALDLFKTMLEAEGFTVFTACNGMAGIKTAVSKNPDLIILDIKMPQFDGFEVLKCLKADTNVRNIPVILLTAYSSENDRQRAELLGAAEYLVKPIDPEKMVMVFLEVLLSMGATKEYDHT